MKEIVTGAHKTLKPMGFRKNRNSFWKIEKEFYYLINFLSGAYGDYFFVNLAVHPVGFPELQSGEVTILSRPREYECLLRQRLDMISDHPGAKKFREAGLVSDDNAKTNAAILDSIATDGIHWLDKWGSHSRLADAEKSEIIPMLTTGPNYWDKTFWMMKAYCAAKINCAKEAGHALENFLLADNGGIDFNQVETHMRNIVIACEDQIQK